jgi:apolipoprotein N-acyltransferase
MKTRIDHIRVSNRILSILMLLGAASLIGFSMGRWLLPPAAWIGPPLIMRYARDRKPGRGYLGVLGACILAMYIAFGSFFDPLVALVIVALYGLLLSLPYLADRLLSPAFPGFTGTLVYPLAATALEFVNNHTNPMGAWGATGFSQYGNLPLMQFASVTGMIGITFLMGWFAGFANWSWEKWNRGENNLKGIAAFGAVLTVVMLFGLIRLNAASPDEPQESVRVAGITSEGLDSFAERAERASVDVTAADQMMQYYWDAYFEATAREAQAGAKVILWPELNGVTGPAEADAYIAQAQGVARQHGIYLAIPLGILDPDTGNWAENKLLVIDPAGTIVMEHVKYGGAIMETSLAGDGELRSVDTPYGVLSGAICWDMDYPAIIQQAGLNGTGLFLVPSKDWAAIDPVHTQMAVFRAIENGMSVVRQTDAGLSIAVDAYGRVLAQTDFFTSAERTMVAQVPTGHVATLYTALGRYFEWLCLVGFLLLIASVILERRTVRYQNPVPDGLVHTSN